MNSQKQPHNHIVQTGEAKLAERGILAAAQQAGVSYYVWNNKPGWSIPLYDEYGERLLLPDGRPAQRWKNFDSSAGMKSAWGYADSQTGQGKPSNCDIYFPLPLAIQDEIAAHKGHLIIACGEPDTWTLIAAGYHNVISPFGEQNIPRDLAERLLSWEVTSVFYYPDQDKTGLSAVQKLVDLLAGSGIALNCYTLPEAVGETAIKDVNDYYRALGCPGVAFQLHLATLPMMTLNPTVQTLPLTAASRPAPSYTEKEFPPAFLEAIEQALGVMAYKPNGWSKPVRCPFVEHEHNDSDPAAAWHRDKKILKCFKCDGRKNAMEVAAALGINLRDYRDNTPSIPFSKADLDQDVEDDEEWDTNADDVTVAPVRQRKPAAPTHDEIGDTLIALWDGRVAYFYGSWQRYEAGVWVKIADAGIRQMIWRAMKAVKGAGFKPTKPHTNSILDYLQSMLAVPEAKLAQNPNLLNLQNGTLNLDTLILEDHNPAHYLTTQLSFDYDPDAECPTWEAFLRQVLVDANGQPDEQLIQLLQEGFGYSLTSETHLEKGFLLYGEAAAGKSTVLKVLQALLNPYFLHLNLSQLSNNHYQLAHIPHKRVVAASEARSGMYLADDLIKQLISGEEITVRQIRQESFTFKPHAKVWWAMNELPQNRDRSNAIYRRLVIMPFNRPVPAEQRDPQLIDKLLGERPGILNLSLTALARLRAQGDFTQAAQVAEQLADYREQSDTEANFLQDTEWCGLDDPEAFVTGQTLHTAYKVWCITYGYSFKSLTLVARDWERLGLKKVKNGLVQYQGLKLTEEANAKITNHLNRI